jgi:hypothetical protein
MLFARLRIINKFVIVNPDTQVTHKYNVTKRIIVEMLLVDLVPSVVTTEVHSNVHALEG